MRRLMGLLLCLLGSPAAADAIRDGIRSDAAYLVALYRDLHQNPELSFQETRSSARLADEMRKIGFEVTTGVEAMTVAALSLLAKPR